MNNADLPKLQSVHLGEKALCGDSRNDWIGNRDPPYNSNTLTMRGESERVDGLQDLPSFTTFRGDGGNCCHFGSVVLESTPFRKDTCRYPSVVVGRNPVSWLRERPFLSVNK